MTDEKLYELCRSAARITGHTYHLSKEEIEDLQSAAFIRFKRVKLQSDSVTPITKFVKRMWIDEFRKNTTQQRIVTKSTELLAERERDTNPISKIEATDEAHGVLEMLSPERRDVMILYMMGYTAKEGAHILGVSLLAYKGKLNHAKIQLRKDMSNGSN